jgi:hypothetical protein
MMGIAPPMNPMAKHLPRHEEDVFQVGFSGTVFIRNARREAAKAVHIKV